jgi:solute carrier family 35 protein F1/2
MMGSSPFLQNLLRPIDRYTVRPWRRDKYKIIPVVHKIETDQTQEGMSQICSPVMGYTERETLRDNSSSSSDFQDGKRNDETWWATIRRRRQEGVLPLEKKSESQWYPLIVGQIIALLASSMNASSFTLNQHFGLNTQFFQMFWFYLLLSLHLFARKERPPTTDVSEPCYTLPGTRIRLLIPWWSYLIISMLDVFPNFMTLLSLRYTSLTSTTLLGSLTVPSTMFFSRHILAKVFTRYHYAGVCLCLAGGILTVWSDVDHDDDVAGSLVHNTSSTADAATDTATVNGGASYRYIGDLLAVAAALAYGLGDTIAEYSIKHIDREEYLGMLGVYGVIFTGLIFPWLEGDAVRRLCFDLPPTVKWQAIAVLVWYVASVLVYYMTEASFLVKSDATLLNLSLQASNLWVILFSVVAYQDLPPAVFYLAVVLVVAGVFVYEAGGHASAPPAAEACKNESDKGLEVEPLQRKTKTDEGNYQTMDKL